MHSTRCPNVTNLLFDPERQIEVAWSGRPAGVSFTAELRIETEDRPGLLAELAGEIASERSNIRRIEAKTDDSRRGEIQLAVEVRDAKHLDRLLKKVRSVSGVIKVERRFQVLPTSGSAPRVS